MGGRVLRKAAEHVRARRQAAGHVRARGARAAVRREPLELASLRVTQVSLRTLRQMADLIEHLAGGGDWGCVATEEAIQIVRFEDGELFLRDGHHRCVASLAAGRKALDPFEYKLEDWRYSSWAAPNLETGFITPYDPRTEIRVADLAPHRAAVDAVVSARGRPAAEEYIMANRESYLVPGGRHRFDTLAELHNAWLARSQAEVLKCAP